MSEGYQSLKFQQFGEKGNLRQPKAHFVEKCKNARTRGNLLFKQFVRTLKGNALFYWYVDLKLETVDSWEEIKKKLWNHFYSTKQIVNMMELTNTK